MYFTYPKDTEITASVVEDFIKQHEEKIKRYDELYNLYVGNAPILNQEEKENYKPDNRLIVNFPRYQVDNFNGFFVGVPPKISYNNPDKSDDQNKTIDDIINDFERRSEMPDLISEMSKQSSIYGHAFAYLYQDEDAQSRAVRIRPQNAFVVYEQTVAQEPLFAVYYIKNEDNEIEGQLHTTTHSYEIRNGEDGIVLTDERPHFYEDVPIVEFVENDERLSLVGVTESLTNAYNKAISEKANDVDYFADAYLSVLGVELDEEGTHKIRDNRIINMFNQGGVTGAKDIVVEFLDKPDGDQTQENLLDRLERLIYETSMIANISDINFGGTNMSGVALEFKLQPMRNLAAVKERKFIKALNRIFKMFFALPTNVPPVDRNEWLDIQYTFTRNLPRNIREEVEIARGLDGVVSKETQLQALSIVDNAKDEMGRMETEDVGPALYDFEKSE
ncbi:phage portal protein [Allofustis seminis]|uniref:phage portal protein n=1 Tax=Allofustis seminis TaxID=166939 RepID=UPI00037808D9|nr:phage portal protein [Allofustis seminis]